MKNLLIICLIFMSMTSCVEVFFERAQPEGVAAKKQFPKSFLGEYVQEEKDTILITPYKIKGINDKTDPDMVLSPDLVLKKYKQHYFLSKRNENGLWEVDIINVTKGKGLNMKYIDGNKEDKMVKLTELIATKKVFNDEGKVDYYVINPAKKELIKLLDNNIFEELNAFKKIYN